MTNVPNEIGIKKLNTQGIELLRYKTELLKNYSELTTNALLDALQKLLCSKIINQETYDIITNNDIDVVAAKNFLLNEPNCTKSKEECITEYNLIKTKLYQTLIERNIIKNKNNYKLDIDELNDTIDIVRTFTIDSDFIREYFKIENDKELSILMKSKGFVEKFSALRLSAIANNFVDKYQNYDNNRFIIATDNPFIEDDGLGHSIEILIKINPVYLEKQNIFNDTLVNLDNLLKLIDVYFEERLLP